MSLVPCPAGGELCQFEVRRGLQLDDPLRPLVLGRPVPPAPTFPLGL